MTLKNYHHVQRTLRHFGHISIISLCLSALFLLTGCSTTSETFDTGAVEGLGAKSITEVNAMVNQGEVGGPKNPSSLKSSPPIFSTFDVNSVDVEAIELSNKTITYRQPEKHRRVWIAPFQDARGNLHEGSIVHTLIRSGYWQMGNNPFYPNS